MSNYQLVSKDKVRELIKEENLRRSILEDAMADDMPLSSSIKLELKSDSGNYQLSYDDILKVLSFYGEPSDFKIINNIAYCTYKDPVSSILTQKTLNEKYIPSLNSYIMITNDSQKPYLTDPNTKYTCRFDIQIENDKDFQVARRLIGPKGNNMKKIVEMCSKGTNTFQMHDVVKLRLRGRGSGFKEGATQEESNEELHLCVSSKYQDKYKIACDEITKLILQIYKEYYNYCRNKGLKTEILRMKKNENIQE